LGIGRVLPSIVRGLRRAGIPGPAFCITHSFFLLFYPSGVELDRGENLYGRNGDKKIAPIH
jgi:hypothetical protein